MGCGNCTVCCKMLQIPAVNSVEGEYCKHCNEGIGCDIYSTRPEACKIFKCCWRQMKVAHIQLRPDNCGVLFEKWSDKTIVGSTEGEISDLILNQIEFFKKENISVVIINPIKKTRHFYLADGETIQSIENDIKCRNK